MNVLVGASEWCGEPAVNPPTSVTIRALAEAHIPEIVDACADWQELAQFGPPYWRPRSEAELKRKIVASAGPEPAKEYYFVLVEADGRLVGECSVHAIDWRNRVAEIGIAIWRPDDRRKGYGQVALREMEAYAFGYLGLRRVEAWIIEDNLPSLGLFDRHGYKREAVLRQRYREGGVLRDVHVLGLLAEDRQFSEL